MIEILPLAFVMVVAAQIVTAFFLATSEWWGPNSLAYVAGAAISVITVVTIAYFAAKGVKSTASGHKHTSTAASTWWCSRWSWCSSPC